MANPVRIPEVEGLRGLAIGLVVVFHFFPSLLPGGFLGVDLFFVISGFVITRRLLTDFGQEHGLHVLPEFYMARIRRLFPALIVVLLFCLITGGIGFFADEYATLGRHASVAASFTINTHLAQELGYFGAEAVTKPLLHLWSIAVEMQFYLLWPIALFISLGLAKSKGERIVTNLVCLALGLGSLAYCIYASPVTPDAGYFSTLARAWEFLIGAQLALLLWKTGSQAKWPGLLCGFALATGLGLIGYGLVTVSPNQPPGLHGLYPTLGAALVIVFAPKHRLGSALFGNRVATGLGKISYALYLWHWPLLSFATILGSERPSAMQSLGLIALALFLSVLTYVVVERPARRLGQRKTLLLLFFPMLGVSAAGATVHEKNGLPFRLGEREAFVAYFNNKAPDFQYFLTKINILETYRMGCNFFDIQGYVTGKLSNRPIDAIEPACTKADPQALHRLLLWGDSHAQQYWYGLHATAPKSLNLLMVASSGCAPKAGVLHDSADDYCVRSNYIAAKTITEQKPNLVLLARQSGYSLEEAQKAAQELERQFQGAATRFVFMAATPTWKADLPRILARHSWTTRPERSLNKLKQSEQLQKPSKEAVVHLSERSFWLDTLQGLCTAEGCLTYVGQFDAARLTSWDYGHLTPVASEFLAATWLMPRLQEALHH